MSHACNKCGCADLVCLECHEAEIDALRRRVAELEACQCIEAQHDETGRVWLGPRGDLPRGYSEVKTGGWVPTGSTPLSSPQPAAEVCCSCGRGGATYGPDPYASEINNDDTPVRECEHC